MKILHVVPKFSFGGMEKIVCSIINNTSKYYVHEILVIYRESDARQWINQENFNIFKLNKPEGQIEYIKLLYKKIKELKPEILMTYNWGATDAIWLGRILGIKKIIHSEHGFNIDETISTSFKRDIVRSILYRTAHDIIVVSTDLIKIMRERFFLDIKMIHFIPNSIDSNMFFQEHDERNYIRNLLGYDSQHIVVGFSGRLDPVKNFPLLVETFTECVRTDPRFRLLIIGDGPERQHIGELCAAQNIDQYVHFVGQKENVIPYLRALDIFLLTSLREQMPMTILEAMSLELPVVASRVGEIPRMLTHGKEGLLFDLSEKSATFAGALLMLRDSRRRQEMGAAARQKILAEFQESVMVEKYRQVIEGHTIV
jgi:glycosyltransferase involved in cell wall biosynthesis